MTEEAQAWLTIIVPSLLTGLLLALFFRGRIGLILSGLLPWLGLLVMLLYQEYFVPYQGGGASMWPIAQLFGGTVAAAIGVMAYTVGSKAFRRRVK